MARKKRSGRYGKVYADLLSDPQLTKLMRLKGGKAAFAVHALALAWCSLHLTDGAITPDTLPILHGKPADAAVLVAADFWKVTETGWQIDGYEAANITRSDVESLKLEGEIAACKRYMEEKGRACACGHHTPTGDRIPVGDLVGNPMANPLGNPMGQEVG